MGAINYKTSDYITLARPFMDSDDYLDEDNNIDYEWMRLDEEESYNIIHRVLDKYDFYYYRVALDSGYYEGFSIDIEFNFSVALDSWEDRRAAAKEITQIRRCLIECADRGLLACSPGWCTSFKDYPGTLQAIDAAIKEMRAELAATPTWPQYSRAGS